MTEKILQLKAFARQDGAILAGVWIASFVLNIYASNTMLGMLLILSTPFIAGKRLFSFRNKALDGYISFRRAYAYLAYTFFFSSILFSIALFLYLNFINPTLFSSILTEAMPIYQSIGYSKDEIESIIKTMNSTSPLLQAFTIMNQNIVMGLLISLPIAAIGTKKK